MAAVFQLPFGDQDLVTLAIVDTAGVPITKPLTPAPVWASSDLTVATVTPATDGMSATVEQVGAVGDTCIVSCQVTPTVGASETVTIIQGAATGIPATVALVFGTPTAIPSGS
jgi:hypothetical protein